MDSDADSNQYYDSQQVVWLYWALLSQQNLSKKQDFIYENVTNKIQTKKHSLKKQDRTGTILSMLYINLKCGCYMHFQQC